MNAAVRTKTSLLLPLVLLSSVAVAQVGDVEHVHDPAIIREGGWYYIYSTGPNIPIRRSRDLMHWEKAGTVFERVPQWADELFPKLDAIWAPDISRFGDEYYLYYSVSRFGKNTSCIGLVVNKTLDPDSPDYQWIDRGKVFQTVESDDWNAIDPHVVWDGDQPWMMMGSFWTGLKLRALDPRTGMPCSRDTNMYSIAARPVEKAVEAPFVVKRDGYFYLFVSFDQCCRGVNSFYHIMVGRSQDIRGPYLDIRGRPMLQGGGSMLLASHGRVRGPGHNSVLVEDDRHWLVHHFYDGEAQGRRTLQIRPILWDEDGWPLAGEPIGTKRDPTTEISGRWLHSVNFGDERVFELAPDGGIVGTAGTWTLEGRTLLLRWPHPKAPGGAWIDRCHLSEDGSWYVGRNQHGHVIRGRREP